MHRLTTTFVLGYHGCDQDVAERLLAGEPFQKSENEYDWLGHGIYFWEANPRRGREFAAELQEASWGPNIIVPTVVGAIIDLGHCLDLMTSAGIRQIQAAYATYISNCEAAGYEPLKNSPDAHQLRRPLDCAVIEHVHEIRKENKEPAVETIRGVFVEGEPVYEGAGFRAKTHIQICVCDTSNIKGVFRVPEDQLR